MDFTSNWLPRAINDLAMIHNNGQLSELLQAHAIECRAIGLPNYSQTGRPGVVLEAKEIGRAAAQLLGVPQSDVERVVRDLRFEHPRRDVAFELIDFFLGRHAEQSEPTAIAGVAHAERHRPRRRVV